MLGHQGGKLARAGRAGQIVKGGADIGWRVGKWGDGGGVGGKAGQRQYILREHGGVGGRISAASLRRHTS